MQQQQEQIDEAIEFAQHDALMEQARELKVSFKKFERVLHPIIEQCTKDSISAGKMKKVELIGYFESIHVL